MAVPTVPYRGIQPFRYVDHAIFLAREEETEELEDLVTIYRGVLLYGASGDGKSSLINAGLLPATMRRGLRPERVRVQPRAGEEIVIERIATTEDDGGERLPSLLAPDGDESSRIVVSVQAFEDRVREACASHRPLLIFDQFEEIITLFEDEAAVAAQRDIVQMLVRLLREPLAVKLLFVFREDYLSKVKHLLAAVPELVDQALRLEPLSADALPTIIRGPFERHPGHFARELDPELAGRVCTALEERFGSSDLSLSEVETVALRLWESDDPQTLLETRGVQGILEDYLGEALDAFSPDLRAAAIALLAQMVTSAGTRNVISAEDLVQHVHEEDPDLSPDLVSEALERLERESRLIRRERRHDIYLYEITSEFLVPWISQRREEARLVQERRRDELRREQERAHERRRLRVLGSIAGAMVIFAAVVAILAVWALSQRNDAQRQSAEARRQSSNVTSLALTSSAVPLRSNRPDLSLLLALAAYREKPRAEARASVFAALTAARGAGEVEGILRGHRGGISSVVFSPDGRTLASGGDDGSIRLWDTRTHKQLGPALRTHNRFGTTLAFSRDGGTLASASSAAEATTIRLWDTRTHKQLGTALRTHNGYVNSVTFSQDGHTLASTSGKTIRLWDTHTHKQLGPALRTHKGYVNSVTFSPNGNTLASANDKTIRLWDTRSHKQLRPALRGPSGSAGNLAFSPDGRALASGSLETIRLWDTRPQPLLGPTPRTSKESFRNVALSPDGHTLASASEKTIRLWDTHTHKQLGPAIRTHSRFGTALAFGPNGNTLASASNKAIRLWDTHTHKQLRPAIRTHSRFGTALAFGPNGNTLASASNKAIRLWDTHTHKQLGPAIRAPTESFNSMAFSADGHTLASASDKAIRLWDTHTHKQLGPALGESSGFLGSLNFSADGRTLAFGDDGGTIRLWNVRTHKPLSPALRGDQDPVFDIAFSPDGRTLASGSFDTIRLWDTRTHKQLGPALHSGQAPPVLAFSRDGRTLASATTDGRVQLWKHILWRNVAELRTEVCDLVGSGLSKTEWAQYASGIPYRETCP